MSSDAGRQGDAQSRIPYPNPGWSRLISLGMAIALSTLIFTYPQTVGSPESGLNRSLLIFLMWGIAIGFIHGVGFIPRMIAWRVVFSPFIGWPLMLYGIVLTLLQS